MLCAIPAFLNAQVASPQDARTTQAYFKDFDIKINTPAFQKRNGFTKYAQMMLFLQKLASSHKDITTISFIGKSQKSRDIPMIVLNKKSGSQDKVKVWIQAGLHGNEPASTEGVLYLIQQLLENPKYQYLLDELEIGIVPMANIDGYQLQERASANGLDLNRDQTKLLAPETVDLKKAFSNFNAEVALDFHEFQPYRSDYLQMGKAGYTVPYDVMILYSGNLNVPQPLRNLTKNTFVKNAEQLLSENKLTYHDYFTTADEHGSTVFNLGSFNPRSSATSYALSNAVSTLIEVRGIDLGKTSFKRRIMTTFLIAVSYMDSAVKNKQELREVLATNQNKVSDIIVKSRREASEIPLEFIDLKNNKLVHADVNTRNSLKLQPVLTRQIPEAYLLLPSEKAAVDKLKILGLNVTQLSEPKRVEVQNYVVTKYLKDDMKYEGVNQQTVETEVKTVSRLFPAGTYVVETQQKNRGLAFETLEPEAGSGFVSFGVVKASLGTELPIYRYMNKKPLSN